MGKISLDMGLLFRGKTLKVVLSPKWSCIDLLENETGCLV